MKFMCGRDSSESSRRQAITLVLTLIASLALTGCASMGKSSQAVLVKSDPPGADILIDGKTVGQTPQYVLVDRSVSPQLQVVANGTTKPVKLISSYRWKKSFFSNLIWLTYAPIGWLIDFATGSAWDIEDSKVIALNNKTGATAVSSSTSAQKPISAIAIAPPLADSAALSDAGGSALESALRDSSAVKARNWTIKPFTETRSVFLANHYDYDGAPESSDMRDIYYDVKADAVYHSRIETRGDRLVLHARLESTLSRKTGTPLELEFAPENNVESLYSNQRQFVQWLPNTVGLDLVQDRLVWNFQNGKQVELAPSPSEHWTMTVFRYANAISLTNQPARREGRAARGVFTLVPAVRISRKLVQPQGLPELENQTFERWWLSAGYGPEIGWQFSRHYIFMNLVPHLYWTEISWRRNGNDESVTAKGLTFQLETGYLFQYDPHWSFKLFSRTVGEDTMAWYDAIKNSSATSQSFQSASSLTAGVSIGYSFEPTLNEKRWIRRSPGR